MARATFSIVQEDGSPFSDSLTSDAIILASQPSQVIRFGSSKTDAEGSLLPSTLSIDASPSAPNTRIDSFTRMDASLDVRNDIMINSGALGIGVDLANLDPSSTSRSEIAGDVFLEGDVTLSNGEIVMRLSDTFIGARDVGGGNMEFARPTFDFLNVRISATSSVIDDLVERSPPIGTLMWVMRGFVQEGLTTSYLLADGSEVSQAEYPELFQLFGSSYGQASESNFKLPKLTGFPDIRNDLKISVKQTLDAEGNPIDLGEEFRIRPIIVAK